VRSNFLAFNRCSLDLNSSFKLLRYFMPKAAVDSRVEAIYHMLRYLFSWVATSLKP
jgi:hypothetical protein